MKPLRYPKTQLFENPGPTHMNLLFYTSTTFFSYNIISTHQYNQLRCLMKFTPTIILKLFCVFFHSLDPSPIKKKKKKDS